MNNTMQQGAKDQAILPFRSALRLCLRGIETRLGRSVVTLVGVALGIAFLMSVLAGFHIKQALSMDAAIARDASRRIAILRSQVGLLRDRPVAILAPSKTHADNVFIKAFIATGIKRVEISAEPAFTVLLGALHGQIDRDTVAHLAAGRVYVFESPTPALTQELEAGGVIPRVLSVALRPEEIRKAQRHVEQERYRMMWIIVVSLLITIGGITNAMLMSVTERFREIATMKCLGALSGFVVKIFLIESSLMGLAGGIAGCVLGLLLPLVAYGYMFGFGRVLSAVNYSRLGGYALVCASVGMILAMVAGIYPARVAAKMIPADALRSEV